MIRPRTLLQWQLSRLDRHGNPGSWISATVPGAVQLDWAAAHDLPDYLHGDNIRLWDGLEDHPWLYRALPAPLPILHPNERLFLILKGVDYACDITLDGQCLHRHVGLQTPVELDITDHWHHNTELDVLIHPAPKAPHTPIGRSQAQESCKPAVAYGWDFHPRLIPLGLWQDAFLEIRAAIHFHQPPSVYYTLSEDCTRAEGRLEAELSAPATENMALLWTLRTANGTAVVTLEHPIETGTSHLSLPFQLDHPELWWPHDQGEPALYTSEVFLTDQQDTKTDSHLHRIGFRRTRLVMAPDQWNEPSTFPKSRSRPPITLEINGRRIFAKGSNWVSPHIFPGALDRPQFEEQLLLARQNNLNILRLWGGAGAPQDSFYELCDELGLMVWQEFPLACNQYPDQEEYLAQLDQESRSLILRLRAHPALVLWCGGNELFNAWSGMTDQSHALRLLNRNTYELDRTTPFLPTTPVDGMGHGHYVFRDPETGEEAWATFQKSSCSAYSEFGSPGPASVGTLQRILPASDLWPPRSGTSWETHHAFGVWKPESWLHLPTLEHYLGPTENLEALVERGQLLQAAGYQGLFEEARRQKPIASMALNWCFNEPWPCAANNSLISWPCEPKPALAAVGQACRPTLASARIRKFAWKAGENFDPEIWILHDGPDSLTSMEVSVWLDHDEASIPLVTWLTGPINANENLRGPRAQCALPKLSAPRFTLRLEVKDHPEFNSLYTLLKEHEPTSKVLPGDLVRTMNL